MVFLFVGSAYPRPITSFALVILFFFFSLWVSDSVYMNKLASCLWISVLTIFPGLPFVF